MKCFLSLRTYSLSVVSLIILLIGSTYSAVAQSDVCSTATLINTNTTCVTNVNSFTGHTLKNANSSGAAVNICGPTTTNSADVWYQFIAETAYPTISLTNVQTNMRTAGYQIQLLTTSNCTSFASVACTNGTGASLSLVTSTSPGGVGLSVGQLYYIRIATTNNSSSTSGSTWGYDICVTDPVTTTKVDYSKSYVNVMTAKLTNGGSVIPGDTLEIRATFVVTGTGTMDSLAFYDTLQNGGGLKFVAGSLALRTNEGKLYGTAFTDAAGAPDAGGRYQIAGLDTAIFINLGPNANAFVRGKLSNTSKPSFYSSTCIIMATYRVVVYANYNTKVNYGGGALTFRDQVTGVLKRVNFASDSIMVYQSPGLCPNAISVTNAVGAESNGTFGTPVGAPPLARNRGTSTSVVGYTYQIFQGPAIQGPQDYNYGIANNTSALFTPLQTWAKPDGSPTTHRLHTLWDIIGDHTGATNTGKGNPPCDTTKVISATNPCGYMLVINSSYKTDTAFQYTVSNLCPNTYYEISAWIRNICSRCSCDSNGKGSSDPAYIPFATGDSSGVQPNLAFEVDGTDYYATGNITYQGRTAPMTDTANRWVKKGFTYLSGSTGSFVLTIRNNAPGGGGNDWAIDDITVATCLPNMKYSPSNAPAVCTLNVITIYDTIKSYFNNYTYYKWQRYTTAVPVWTDIAGASGSGSPTFVSGNWQYVASYTLGPVYTQIANNGDKYRVVVATTASNISNTNCIVSDGGIVTMNVIACPPALAVKMLSFNGRLVSDHASLSWRTSKEDDLVHYDIEKSTDGVNYTTIGTVNGNNNNAETNQYEFVDPTLSVKSAWYRIVIINTKGDKKYSSIIQLGKNLEAFALGNVINPFNNELAFDITTSKNAKIDVSLVDMFGKTVRTKTFSAYNGVNSLNLDNTEALSAGTYILQVSNGETIINKRVLKK